MQAMETLLERLEQLERFVRMTRLLVLLGLVAVVSLIAFGRYALASSPDEKILHVRGIVIEDAMGHPRMLIGAPVSNQGRKRQDDVTGLVLLASDGTDRLTIGTADYDHKNGLYNIALLMVLACS